jgi:preprotein translocase subunit SecD
MDMAEHTEISWKPENPITQLHNSVEKATDAVKQAASHPSQQQIEQAENAIDHAENAEIDALQKSGNHHSVQLSQEQLDQNQELLQRVQPMKQE